MFRFAAAATAPLLALALLQGGGAASAAGQAMLLPVDPAPLVIETPGGAKSFSVEIADTEEERERGLMFREPLDADHGMLFVFEETGLVAFWMKNTPQPLDLIFIGEEGRIDAVRSGIPYSEAAIAPNGPIRFVLEIKAGVAKAEGIEAGERVRHPRIDAVAGRD